MDLIRIKQIISSNEIIKKIFEPLLTFYVSCRYIFTRSFTKEKEDIQVINILRQRFGLLIHDVKYFDIGANHYLRGNNTYLCYRKGGKGALIEADPFLCNGLSKHRKKDIIVNAAITDLEKRKAEIFYVCSLPTRSTLDPTTAEELKKQGFIISKEITIPCMNFEMIVQKTGIVPDYLSIDIESYDLRVLKSIDLNKYPIKVILAENDNGMAEYMETQGYECIRQFSSNILFARKTM